ncbi:MAG: alkylhydroperoxidase-related (seleno)protein [Acidimicrobiales bacterium]
MASPVEERRNPPLEVEGPPPLVVFEMLVDREWTRLARPGTWWTAGERLAIAADARRAAGGEPLSGVLPGPVEEATRRLAVDASTVRGIDVARWEHEGLAGFPYVEVVGIVSRVVGLDVTAFGLDQKAPLLPEPEAGEPTRQRGEGAALTTGWAPTVGPTDAVSSLSAVPAEAEAMFDLQRSLYLTIDEMAEPRVERNGLTRAQMELVAARTAALCRCAHGLLEHTAMLRAGASIGKATLVPGPIVRGVGDTGIHHGAAITAFVDAVVLRDEEEIDGARATLEEALGSASTDRVAMIAGNFSMVSRVLDAVGAPIDPRLAPLAAEMGITIPDHLAAGRGRSVAR